MVDIEPLNEDAPALWESLGVTFFVLLGETLSDGRRGNVSPGFFIGVFNAGGGVMYIVLVFCGGEHSSSLLESDSDITTLENFRLGRCNSSSSTSVSRLDVNSASDNFFLAAA